MTVKGNSGWNGKERRSGADRRKKDRRNPERNKSGVLTTRVGERRQRSRRTADQSKKTSKSKG